MTEGTPPNERPNPGQQYGQQPPFPPQPYGPYGPTGPQQQFVPQYGPHPGQQPPGAIQPYQQQPPQQWQPYYPPQPVVSPKSPAAGLIVSIFLPGVGSMMAGKVGKGVGILIGYIIGAILSVFVVGIFIAIPLWIWGMVAGYQDAVAWNRAHGIVS